MSNWHSDEMKRMAKRSTDSLHYIIKDCREAAEAGKGFNPKVGQYLDQIHYANMELRKRELSK